MAKKKQAETKGNHLTVSPDGSLSWDWDALLKEVQDATGLVPVTEAKVRKTRKKTAE